MNKKSTADEITTRAWIDIDLGALLRNGKALAVQSQKPLLPMLKADAYGLGAVPVARALEALDPWGFGVATVEEAEELRGAGIVRRIILLAPPAGPSQFDRIRAAAVIPTLGDARSVLAWHRSGAGDWHLSIDTGMNRAGIRYDNIDCIADIVRVCPPAGACTHFHSAELDNGTLAQQTQRFRDALAALPSVPGVLHVENSAAIERASPSPWSFSRPGVFLYGVGSGGAIAPEPVVSFRARVVAVSDLNVGDTVSYDATWTAARPTRIATVAAGYADGYRRSLSNAGSILVNGHRTKVVGTVTMDMTMIDVTDVPCDIGDIATLIGRDGDHELRIADLATASGLSPYEILTGLRARAQRAYRA